MTENTASSRIVTWQLDSANPEMANQARDALRQVVDPELGLNVIELGLIRDLDVEPDRAHLTMILTTPFCPYGPAGGQALAYLLGPLLSFPLLGQRPAPHDRRPR